MVDDLSEAKENTSVRALNGVGDDKLLVCTYITSILYPECCNKTWYTACGCMNCCSNSKQYLYALKNGCSFVFNEKGIIVRRQAVVYESGASCRCSSSCVNRVNQHGL